MKGCNLHVANIIHYIYHGGGVAVQALNIARCIENLNTRTSFSTIESGVIDPSCEKLVSRYPGRIYTSQQRGDILAPLVLSRNLKTIIKNHKCSVIQAYDPLVSGLASYLVKIQEDVIPLAIRLGTDYLAHFSFQFNRLSSSSLMKDISNTAKRRLLLPMLSIIEKTTLHAADAVVANCEYLRGIYKQRYPNLKNITVIRNGVDTEIFTPEGQRENLTNNKLTLLYVGRIEERKGLEVLLLAMSKVFKKHPESRLLLVGRAPDPRYYTRLEELARNQSITSKIKFMGAVDNQSIPRLMRSADILIFPSSTHGEAIEGLPNSVLEGLATGLPVVATRVCGVPEVIDHERNGLLVTPGSIYEMEHSIDTLINSESRRLELGKNARRSVVHNNSMVVAGKKYLKLYQHLVSTKYNSEYRIGS